MNPRILNVVFTLSLLTAPSVRASSCYQKVKVFSSKHFQQEIIRELTALKSPRIKRALQYAYKKHLGVYRKFDGRPYFDHPLRVAYQVYKRGGSHDQIIAALLHDTVEDTDATIAEIKKLFGAHVARLVDQLTSNEKELERVGKRIYLAKKLSKMDPEAFFIKLLDRLDNVSDFDLAPEAFVKKYSEETYFIISNLYRDISTHDLEILKEIRFRIIKAKY
ncbi:HD domain-containing protein [Halobacteriovorax sp. GB3]|uniref:HD domain-containing protein n=1 Tax=Halobacteriovorax sp. GB3 TaxID=2719615 RepID=UPI002362ACBC|nr:HD domain-containing protein [Halobacteriovorax sp. GB3]MDD0851505.1 HD domain-containing protein [Halobacteriovorax sp. GB3]